MQKDVAEPVELGTTSYMKRPKWGRYTPFGYEDDPDDPKFWRPIPAQIDALKLAFRYLKSSTYADVARWLVDVTGREFTPEALRRLVEKERYRQNSAKALAGRAAKARRYGKALTKEELRHAEEAERQAKEDITVFRTEGVPTAAELPDVIGLNASRTRRIRSAALSVPKPERASNKQVRREQRYAREGLDVWQWDEWPTSCFPA